MCGIVGVANLHEPAPVARETIEQMLAPIRHRGPDEFGIYTDARAGLGNARLSIIDLSGGQQPIGNEDGTLWIVFNGEIFNYLELRPRLEALGHRFATQCDTEVVLHLYEEYGPACLQYLNGQFAIAIWDQAKQTLFLARDRVGIRPLFYTVAAGQLIFGSEIKALLGHPAVKLGISAQSLAQVFTFWSVLPPATIFENILQLPPGHYLLVKDGRQQIQSYWSPDFTKSSEDRPADGWAEELESLLIDATQIRLRADVPVGAYLSGGLDSSLTTAFIRRHTDTPLDTFSIAFSDPQFDESPYQRRMAQELGTDHRVVYCTHEDIGRVFPDVIRHVETPLLRTAPAPMFLLSQLVHDHSFKVVITGEGADEILGGYDIFKEMAIRRFWARFPNSQLRPLLLGRLYPEIGQLNQGNNAFLMAFFKKNLEDTQLPYYSHLIRWANTARNQRFLAQEQTAPLRLAEEQVPLPDHFAQWSGLAQAQYLEMTTFLSPYLLAAQGDRVAMAHSVEGRFPFLDYRVIEFCNRLPDRMKLHGLTEKWLMRQIARKYLPAEIGARRKRPYRAPIQHSFFGTAGAKFEYVRELLAEEAVIRSGLFNPRAVGQLVNKAVSGALLSENDNMALAGILSTQLVDQQFVRNHTGRRETLRPTDRVKVVNLSAKENVS
ncbi:asparagine synthase (glutamine-hydrolysing) [Thermoflexales bacterium]|nr:asparagine synthase (glutamine-hydrolysing) [Thermoflexales bacterium]